MTVTEKLHQLIPPGTLTGLRDIAKRPGTAPDVSATHDLAVHGVSLEENLELQSEYTDYLTQKYQ